ncbi:phage tail tube protein, partial [Salmonella enterica]
DTTATLAWKPGETGQKKLVELFDTGEVRAFRIRYPNGTVDVFRGWLSSLGKTVTPRPRWPGNPVRPDRKNWLSCLTPAKFAPSVS